MQLFGGHRDSFSGRWPYARPSGLDRKSQGERRGQEEKSRPWRPHSSHSGPFSTRPPFCLPRTGKWARSRGQPAGQARPLSSSE